MLQSVGYGAAEIVFDRYLTLPVMQRSASVLFGKGGRDLIEGGIKNYFKAEQYLKSSLLKLDSAELNYFLGNTYKIQDKNLEAIDAYKTIHSLADGYPQFKPIAYTSESDYHGLILKTGFIFPTRDITMEVAKKLNLPRVSLRNGTWTGDSISIPLVSLEIEIIFIDFLRIFNFSELVIK